MCLSRIARTYNGSVGVATSTPPPNLFYHSGGMNLRERPRVKGTSKKIRFWLYIPPWWHGVLN